MINFLEDLNYYFVRNSFLETVGRVMLVVTAVCQFVAIACLFIAMAVYKFHATTGIDSMSPNPMPAAIGVRLGVHWFACMEHLGLARRFVTSSL